MCKRSAGQGSVIRLQIKVSLSFGNRFEDTDSGTRDSILLVHEPVYYETTVALRLNKRSPVDVCSSLKNNSEICSRATNDSEFLMLTLLLDSHLLYRSYINHLLVARLALS